MDVGFNGKTAIVTGASGGIGSAVAKLFAEEGADVAVHYRSGNDRAKEVQEGLSAKVKSGIFGADLTSEAETASLFEAVENELGPASILIANAGVWPTEHTPIHEMSFERWNQTVANNLNSVFLCVRQFLQRCQQHSIDDPSIVMIGSTAGHFGEANHGDYAASKSGLMWGLTQTLKNEIPAIAQLGRINTVCPGWTMTPMAKKFQDNQDAMLTALQTIPMRKFASPTDIAHAVLFFASNVLSGHITGERLFVSGGMEGRVLNSRDQLDLQSAF